MMEKTLEQVLERDPARVAAEGGALTRSEQGLLRLFDGVRPLATVVALSPLPPADTLDVIARLGKLGLVRPRSAGSALAGQEAPFTALEERFFAGEASADDHEEPLRLFGGRRKR